ATPPHLPVHTADLPIRSYRTVARCCRRGMTLGEFGSQCVLVRVAVTKPALGLRSGDLLSAALGGRPRPRVAIAAFASAAEADLGLLPGGVLPTRVSTRSAVSRSVN